MAVLAHLTKTGKWRKTKIDGRTTRQGSHPNGRSRSYTTLIPEHVTKQLTSPVNNLGVSLEVEGSRNIASSAQ